MIRFFTQRGTLRLQGVIIESMESLQAYSGDITTLLNALRAIPEYQIDRFHQHCGIKVRLAPALDFLQKCIPHAGICAECWSNHRHDYNWIGAKRALTWNKQSFRLWDHGHSDRHAGIRDLFTATERLWDY
jgi:hypothetical protein